jgi:GT2 family glycosyltransferase
MGGMPLRLIRNESNLGFAAANNQAIAATGAPLVLLLNPDTVVRPGAIDGLVEALIAHPRAAAAGARLLTREGKLQVSVLHCPPAPLEVLADGLHLARLVPQPYRGEWMLGRHWKHDRLRNVPLVFATAMLVRRQAITEAGGFDERFPLYAVEEEWCVRLRRKGWSILFVPTAEVVHFGRQSSLQRYRPPELNREIVASRLRAFSQCLSGTRFGLLVMVTLATYVPNLLLQRLFRRQESGGYLEAACRLYFQELTGFCRTGVWPSANGVVR